jgi:hypothetical protein
VTDRSFVEANRAATAEIRSLVESLSDAELGADLGGGWTVSMALAHLAYWDEFHTARWIHAAEQGELAPPAADGEVTDRNNEALVTTWRALPPRVAADLMLNAAAMVDEYVADLDDEAIDLALERDSASLFRRSPHRQDHIGQISRALGR